MWLLAARRALCVQHSAAFGLLLFVFLAGARSIFWRHGDTCCSIAAACMAMQQQRRPVLHSMLHSAVRAQCLPARPAAHQARTCSLARHVAPEASGSWGGGLAVDSVHSSWMEALEELHVAALLPLNMSTALFNSVIKACARERQWRAALLVLDSMLWSDLLPDAESYDAAIWAVAPRGNARVDPRGDLVLGMLQEMWCAFEDRLTHGPQPDAQGFRAAMRSFSHAGQWQGMLHVLRAMRERGVHADAAMHEAAMGSSPWDQALLLLRELPAHSLETSAQAYSVAAEACMRDSRAQAMMGLLAEVRQRQVASEPRFYDCAIAACERTGAQQWMQPLLQESLQALWTCGEQPDLSAFEATMASCVRCSTWQLALGLLQRLSQQELEPSAGCLSAAAWACAANGHGPRSLSLVRGMQQQRLQPSAVAYLAAMHQCIVADSPQGAADARDLYREGLELGAFKPWRTSGRSVNASALPPEAAALAVRVLLEETRRSRQLAARPLEIRGASSELQPLQELLRQEFNVSADCLRSGEIVVTRPEARRLWQDFIQAPRPSNVKRKLGQTEAQKAFDRAFQPPTS